MCHYQIDENISYGKYLEALEKLKLIEKKRTLTSDEYLLKIYVNIFILLDNGEFHRGKELADKMIKESRKQCNILMEIDALIGKIEHNYSLSIYNESFELVEQGENLLKKINDKEINQIKKRQAYLLFLKGKLYRDSHNIKKALELFKQSYELRKEINDRFGMIWSLSELGISSTTIGDFKIAKKYLKEGITLTKELDARIGLIWCLVHIGWVSYHLRDLNSATSYAKECLSICHYKKNSIAISLCYDLLGHCSLVKGDLKNALLLFKDGLNIRKENKFNNLIPYSYCLIGEVYCQKGEFKKSIEYFDKIIEIKDYYLGDMFKPMYLNALGKIYGELGEYKIAKKYLLEALDFLKKKKIYLFQFINFNISTIKILHNLIVLSINNKDFEKVNNYLDDLYQIKLKHSELKQVDQIYRLDKGIILKSGNRLMNKIKAEKIFNEIIEEERIDNEITIEVMKNQCEIYLYELEISGEKYILQEMEMLSDKLFMIAESEELFDTLAEAYFLKAKIALLNLDINNARLLLTKAQNIANEYELTRLASKISNQHDSLLMNLDKWEEKIEQNLTLKERLINSKNDFLFFEKDSLNSIEKEDKNEIPVYFLIINNINAECIYNKAFQNINMDDGSLIAGYISAINIFGKEAFNSSGSINRIRHGEYITILALKEEFLFGYIFKGYSYSAISKLNKFIKELSYLTSNFENITLEFERNLKLPEELHITMENLVENIFLMS